MKNKPGLKRFAAAITAVLLTAALVPVTVMAEGTPSAAQADKSLVRLQSLSDFSNPESINLHRLINGGWTGSEDTYSVSGNTLTLTGGAYTITTSGNEVDAEIVVEDDSYIILENAIIKNANVFTINSGSEFTIESKGNTKNSLEGSLRMGDGRELTIKSNGKLNIYTPVVGDNSTLTITGGALECDTFQTGANSTLRIDDSINGPALYASNGIFLADSTVELFNYTPPAKASLLAADTRTLLVTNNDYVTGPKAINWAEANDYNYITLTGERVNNSKEYAATPMLSWNTHGNFTLKMGDFTLDEALDANSQTLVKDGNGTLFVTEENAIDTGGAVIVNNGTIQLENANQRFYSGSVVEANGQITGNGIGTFRFNGTVRGKISLTQPVFDLDGGMMVIESTGDVQIPLGGLENGTVNVVGALGANTKSGPISNTTIEVQNGGRLTLNGQSTVGSAIIVAGGEAYLTAGKSTEYGVLSISGGKAIMRGTGAKHTAEVSTFALTNTGELDIQDLTLGVTTDVNVTSSATITTPRNLSKGEYPLIIYSGEGGSLSEPILSEQPEASKPLRGHTAKLIAEDGTLFLLVEIHECYITYDPQNKEKPFSEEWYVGEKATPPKNEPTLENHVFTGWYTEPECNELYDFETILTVPITLYAGWREGSKYTITYHPENGEDAFAAQWYDDELPVAPNEPTLKDHTFTGWYTEKECKNKYAFDEPLIGNIDLYAGWKEDTSTSDPGTPTTSTTTGPSTGSSTTTTPTTAASGTGQLSVSGLPATIRVGDTFTLIPEESDTRTGSDGWKWDNEYFSATFNSPATFTALKAGNTEITFTSTSGRTLTLRVEVQVEADGSGSSSNTGSGSGGGSGSGSNSGSNSGTSSRSSSSSSSTSSGSSSTSSENSIVSTGDGNFFMLYLVLAMDAVLAIILLTLVKPRKKRKN